MSARRPERSFELQPLVLNPGDVRVFTHQRRAGVAEVAPTGHLRLDTIARWAQDVAWADVEDAGLRDLTIWLVRRTRMRVRRFPELDRHYELCTYVTGVGRMWAERRTDIIELGGSAPAEPVVQVSCIWVHIDPERLLPSPIHAREIAMWANENTRVVKARLRHPAPPPPVAPDAAGAVAAERRWTFRASEMDIAGHVNNAAYFTPFDDELLGLAATGGGQVARVDLEIEYRAPSQAGERLLVADGDMRWIIDPAGEVNASAVLADWPLRS